MKEKWEQFSTEVEKSNSELNDFLSNSGLNTLLLKKAEKFVKQWNNTKKLALEIEKYIMVVDPLEIQFPFKNERLTEMWQRWKDYLSEQHGQLIRTRSEKSAIEHLMELAKGDEEKAVKFLRYAMTNRYKNFFAIEDKDTKQPDKRETKGSDFD
ncbi:MAG: hypothetical protein WCJ03_08355 [Bacteroidales bacterium]|jgi:hypothetical protein